MWLQRLLGGRDFPSTSLVCKKIQLIVLLHISMRQCILLADAVLLTGQVDGDVRLVDTMASPGDRGRLEIFLNGNWGSVCSIGFSVYAADLACIELGFLYSLVTGRATEQG